MKELSQEESLDYDIPRMLQAFTDLAVETGEAMFETELTKKNPQFYEEASNREKEFKALLRQLYFWYKPKFDQADGAVELPEDLEEKLDDAQDVWQLSFDESRELFRTIRQLMEQIGHTKFETEDHSDMGV